MADAPPPTGQLAARPPADSTAPAAAPPQGQGSRAGESSRADILASLRRAQVPAAALPEVPPGFGVRFADKVARFAEAVAEVGGKCALLEGSGHEALEDALSRIDAYASATRVASLVPGVRKANVDLSAVRDPHDLRDLDFCVLPGELGVAESGAVWVVRHGLANRAAAFLTQHLALVLSRTALVHNLHEAYARIQVPRPGFGLFLSGPSKTADIEQALVIGAHGARSCTVLLTP